MFKPAEKKKKYLKILVYGSAGNGKTHFALTFPKCAVIDTESGTDFFVGKSGIGAFDVLGVRSYKEAIKAINYLEQKGQGKYETLVIDSETRIYRNLVVTGQKVVEDRAIKHRKSVDDAGLGYREWGIIKHKYESLMDLLYNLPFHTVITCWLKDVYTGGEKTGVTYDCEKSTEHQADIILRMEVDESGTFWGIVEKDRTGHYPKMSKIKNPSFETFKPILEKFNEGAKSVLPSAEKAVEQDAGYFRLEQAPAASIRPKGTVRKKTAKSKGKGWTDEEQAKIKEYQEKLGLSDDDIRKMLVDLKKDKEAFFLALKGRVELREKVGPIEEKKEEPGKVTVIPPKAPVKDEKVKPIRPLKFSRQESLIIKTLNKSLGLSQNDMIKIFNDCKGDNAVFINRLENMINDIQQQKAA